MKPNVTTFFAVILFLMILAACSSQNLPEPEADAVSTIPPLPTAAADPTQTPVEEIPPSQIPEASIDPYAAYGFSGPVTAKGQVLVLFGRVLDASGDPVPEAIVEIWQTDANGIYDHPGDSSTASRDLGFQFYGTSAADVHGNYAFRTIRPGEYEPRPPHIHLKIRVNGQVVLTSQLYFSDTGNAGGLGAGADQLLLSLEADPHGGDFWVAAFDFVVDTGIGSGSLPLTPGQAEGPYYPVVDVSGFDPDLALVGE